jgi:hypothetical protein
MSPGPGWAPGRRCIATPPGRLGRSWAQAGVPQGRFTRTLSMKASTFTLEGPVAAYGARASARGGFPARLSLSSRTARET